MDKRERWNERYAKKELTWSSRPNALLESLVVGRPAGKVLDVASGEGRNALWLASRGWQVGSDPGHGESATGVGRDLLISARRQT